MKILVLSLLFSAFSYAQSPALNFYIDTSNGQQPTSELTPLPSTYQFPDTPVGSSSSIAIRVVNGSAAGVAISVVFVGASANSAVATPNFTITGLDLSATLAPQAWKLFTLNFTPTVTGAASGYLQAQLAGTTPLNAPPPFAVSTVQGNGTGAAGNTPGVTLMCSSITAPQPLSLCNGNVMLPTRAFPINVGNVPITSEAVINLVLVNNGSIAVNPQTFVTLPPLTNNANPPFALGPLPATLTPNSSVSFTVTYAPGTASSGDQATLVIGQNTYLLQGVATGSLAVSFFSPVCKCATPASRATPIPFGQLLPGSSETLTITIENSTTATDAFYLPVPQVSGSGFTLSGTVPTAPTILQPGQSISFDITFTASAVNTYNGTLMLGTWEFPLQAQTIAPLVSSATFQVDVQPLTSQQQAHLTITVDNAPVGDLIGILTMQFVSAVNNVTSDPAIIFVASNSQQMNVTVPSGSLIANYKGQSPITFQTGTTAGTITFTLQFPNSPVLTKSFTIAGSKVQVTSITAVRQYPNLVVTITGYDNTYSAGPLSFVFATSSTGNLTVSADATSAFHQYFFTNDTAGGAFVLEASFPVNGDVTQVSSVAATVNNSAGQTTVNQPFQ